MKTIKLLTNIMIDGRRVGAGSVVTVPASVARDLLHRRRAELVEDAPVAPDAVPVDEPEAEPSVPTADEAEAPRKRRRK